MAFWSKWFGGKRTDAPRLTSGISPTPAPPETRNDGVMNRLMGHGVWGADKRNATYFQADVVDDETALELWRGNDLAKKLIEAKVHDAMRNGYEFRTGDDKDIAADLATALHDIGGDAAISDAKKAERAYGGAAIFPYANDGGDPSEPLDENRITEITHLINFEPRELQVSRWYNDFGDKKFRRPKAYRMFPLFSGGMASSTQGMEVHESRLIIFGGIRVTNRYMQGTWPGWGDSEFTHTNRQLSQFDLSWSSSNALLNDFAQAVLKIKGLADAIADGAEDDVKKRLALMDLMRSTLKMIPIDSEDEFTRVTTPISGLADMLDRQMIRIAACFGMPVTKLFGRSPAGMNATGKSDQDVWDDDVKTMQDDELEDPILRLGTLMLKSKKGPTGGKIKAKAKLTLKWKPLRNPTPLETAQAHKEQALADEIYMSEEHHGAVVSPEEIAHSRFAGDGYSFETVVDWKARAAGDMVVDPPVIPEPLLDPNAPPPLDPNAPPAPPAAPPTPAELAATAAADKRRSAAQQAADSLPQRARYDVLDVAMQKQAGVMIALYLPSTIAQAMAIDGGEAAADLHVTLAYLGTDIPDVAIQRAAGVAYDAAMRRAPLLGKIAGIGRFPSSTNSGGLDVVYAAVDSADITDLRQCIVGHLECLSVPVSKDHGFIPHVTLAYVAPDAKSPIKGMDPYEIEFGAIVVAAGGERLIYPFKGDPADRMRGLRGY